MHPNQHAFKRIEQALITPVDAASVVAFRVFLGSVLGIHLLYMLRTGAIELMYVRPAFFFSYYGFEWIKPWPGIGNHVHYVVTMLLAFFFAAGLFYRITAVLLFGAWTYLWLLEAAYYQNHFYLISLLLFLMALMPAHTCFSIDARRGSATHNSTIPAWCLYSLRAQIGLTYFFGGIAKLHPDWLHGEPMRTYFRHNAQHIFLGRILDTEPGVYFFTYGGLLFDLFVVPALMWRRSRNFALLGAVLFNLANLYLFDIDFFPLLALAGTLLFYPPDWPRRAIAFLLRLSDLKPPAPPASRPAISPHSRRILLLLALHFTIQLLVPLRHWLYPGDLHWTEEGRRFAWQMKSRNKYGQISFIARDPHSKQQFPIEPSLAINPRQLAKMKINPDMIVQFARQTARALEADGHRDIEIYARATASLNGRPFQPLIDPKRDLTKVRRTLGHADWVLPLNVPLSASTSRAAPPVQPEEDGPFEVD